MLCGTMVITWKIPFFLMLLFFSKIKVIFFPIMIGVEARGFIFGPPIALAIGAKFVPLRKPRKLPGTSKLST